MSKTLEEYADWLVERNFNWPASPTAAPVKAIPYLKPLPEVRAVTWAIYGTVLLITDGRLVLTRSDPAKLSGAFEKTLQEFQFSEHGAKPFNAADLLKKYMAQISAKQLANPEKPDVVPEADAAAVWKTLLEGLGVKSEQYDADIFGDLDELSEKVAFYFESSLQGTVGSPNALSTLRAVVNGGFMQGIIGDGQIFTLTQVLRGLRAEGDLDRIRDLFDPMCVTLSFREGVRLPSKSLFAAAVEKFRRQGMAPKEVLHISSRVGDDLAIAKKLGFRTALFTGDKSSLQATSADLKDPALKPDRILTDLGQVLQILEITK